MAIRTTSVETAPVVAEYGELAASEMTEDHFAAAESVKRQTVQSQHAGWKATADLQQPDDGRESTSVCDVANVDALPVFDWNQGGIAEAQANVIAAEQSVERVELSLQQRLAAVYQQYEQARKQAARYETTILQKARKIST